MFRSSTKSTSIEDNTIDCIAVDGICGGKDDTWKSLNESTWSYPKWFGVGIKRVSVYGYSILDERANIFVRDGLQCAAVQFLEAVLTLDRASGSHLVLIGHDFGGVIIKQALIIAASGDPRYRDVYRSIRVIFFLACPHTYRSSLELESSLQRLLNANRTASVQPTNLFVRNLGRNIVDVNCSFVQIKMHSHAFIFNALSCHENKELRVFDPCITRLTIDDCAHTHQEEVFMPHTDIPREITENFRFESGKPNILGGHSSSETGGFIRQLLSRTTAHTPLELLFCDDHVPQNVLNITQNTSFSAWILARGVSVLKISNTRLARKVSAKIRTHIVNSTSPGTDRKSYTQYFEFNPWDCRSNSVESMLSSFLARYASDVEDLISATSEFDDLSTNCALWNLEDLFLVMYNLLFSEKHAQSIWILVNLDERIKGYQWLFERLQEMALNSEVNLKTVLVHRHEEGPAISALKCYTIDLESQSEEIGDLLEKERPGDATAGISRDRPSATDHRMFEVILESPKLYLVTSELKEFLASPNPDPDRRQLILAFIHTSNINLEPSFLLKLFSLDANVSNDALFNHLLHSVFLEEDDLTEASYILEIVAHSFRPLTIHEMVDLSETCRWNGRNRMYSNAEDAILSQIPGFLSIHMNEIHFSHEDLRTFFASDFNETGLKIESPASNDVHCRIALLCLEYLCSTHGEEKLALYVQTNYEEEAVPECRLDFLSYAVTYWCQHARLAGDTLALNSQGLQTFIRDKNKLDLWARAYWSSSSLFIGLSANRTTPFAIFAMHGLLAILKDVMTLHAEVPTYIEECSVALTVAAWSGDLSVVELLLHVELPPGKSLDNTLLASLECIDDTVSMLILSKSLSIPGHLKDPHFIIRRAARLGRKSIVATMLTTVPELDNSSGHSRAILNSACKYGYLEIIQSLVKDHNTSSTGPGILLNALWTAIWYGQHDSSRVLMEQLLQSLVSEDSMGTNGAWNEHVCFTDLHIMNGAERPTSPNKSEHEQEHEKDLTVLSVAHGPPSIKAGYTAGNNSPTGVKNLRTVQNTLALAVKRGQHQILLSLLSMLKGLDRIRISTGNLIQGAISNNTSRCLRVLLEELFQSSNDPQKDCSLPILLEFAMKNGDVATYHELVAFGARFTEDTFSGLLERAVSQGDKASALVGILVQEGKTAIVIDKYMAALSNQLPLAVEEGFSEIAQILIQGGADVQQKIKGTGTLLYKAVISGQIKTVEHLLAAKADMTIPEDSEDKLLPIHAAKDNVDILRLLMDAGADIDAKTSNNSTILNLPPISKMTARSYQEILKYKPDLNCVVEDVTPLVRVIAEGKAELATALLDASTDPCHPETRNANRLLLHACVARNLEDILKRLLLFNFQIEERDDYGQTPLNSIQATTSISIPQLLINRGAEINTADEQDWTPLSRAILFGDVQKAELFISKGANVQAKAGIYSTTLHLACSKCSLEMVQILVKGGANINYVDQGENGTLFHTTSFRTDDVKSSILNYLLDNTEVIARQSSDLFGTNLHTASLQNDLGNIAALIELGAHVNAEDRIGKRPIHHALYRTIDYVRLLRQKGAALFVKDKMGRNALHFAVVSGRLELVKYILEEQKDLINEKDCDGWTPLMWALRDCLNWWGTRTDERAAIIRELKSFGADLSVRGEGLGKVWTPYTVARYHGLSDEIIQLLGARSDQNFGDAREAKQCPGLVCDVCLMGIVGLFYKCDQCSAFDICFKCFRSKHLVHPRHAFTARNEGEEYKILEKDGVNDANEAENEEKDEDSISSSSSSV